MKEEITNGPSIDAAAVIKIAEHYCHAKRKHPHFADRIIDYYCVGPKTRFAVMAMEQELQLARKSLAARRGDRMVTPDILLQCEVLEANLAYAQNDIHHAVEECYDAIAVLLRMIDVLEGRQALGRPQEGGEE